LQDLIKVPPDATQPLFRPEVMQAHVAQHLGAIRIGRNPTFAWVALASLAFAAALVSFAAWGQVTRKARIPGVLMPTLGTLQVTAPAMGVITELRAKEGEQVQVGQVLFVINTDRTGAGGETGALIAQNMQQRRTTLETERTLRGMQAQQRRTALADRIRALETEQIQANNEAAIAERRQVLSTKTLDRYKQLVHEGFVAEAQAQQRQEEHLDLEARLDAAERNAGTLLREQQSVRSDMAAIAMQVQAEQGQIDRALAALEQERHENHSRQMLVVTASQAGTVTAHHAHVGTAVQSGQALATLVPSADSNTAIALEAQLFAASRSTGFIEKGQTVWLRYAAYPYQKFGLHRGTVEDISQTPVNPQELPAGQGQRLLAATQSNEGLYRIRVTIERQVIDAYGEQMPLKPGMALDADVTQGVRAIWEWALEPLIAIDQRHRPI
jgi:membrane fusion protein